MKWFIQISCIIWYALVALLLLCPSHARAQIAFDRQYGFQGAPTDGSHPEYSSSLAAAGSVLYGTTQLGGQSNNGALFVTDTNLAIVTVLHSFDGYSAFTPAGSPNDGTYPYGTPVVAGNMIYGVTGYGGSNGQGTIYAINTNGTGFTILHHFGGSADGDGYTPHSSLTLAGSTLYGMTIGGTNDGTTLGTIFSINTNGNNYQVLYSFGPEGYPQGALIVSGTTLYGMTFDGGSNNAGNIFEINTDGTSYQDLHSFTDQTDDGGLPIGSLTLMGTTLYGMTSEGGSNNVGTIFSMNTDGSGFNILHNFSSQEASEPVGRLILSGSGQMFYGMAQDGGTNGSSGHGAVFQIAIDGGDYQILHSFEYANPITDGDQPWDSPLLINSELYGLTSYGGSTNDDGGIFAMPATTDTSPPSLTITSPSAGLQVNSFPTSITGTATDNVGVYEVKVEYNNGPWQVATSANGYSTWQSGASFVAGTNTIQAYAIDLSGNVSPTNFITIDCVFESVLTVQTNGAGTIANSLNGQSLQIGSEYSMTATPDSGSVFVNWTDGNDDVVTNGATVNFLMTSNLTLAANFQDITPPTLAITSPLAGATLNNSQVTVTGTATDNVDVSNVFYSLNGGVWTNPNLAGTNWSVQITAVLGTNTFAAYAVDTSGNISPTNSVTFEYVIKSGLTVITNGPGTVNPSLGGQSLQIGTEYFMTAAPYSGSAFVDWTDGNNDVVTNGATVAFIMASNLVFIANFQDVTPPVLTITAPKAGNIFSNNPVMVTGTATDNVAVASVFYSFNGGAWTNASLAGPNWSVQTNATIGTNTFAAYAVDTSGNISPTNSVTFQYVQYAVLAVSTNGAGTINPPLNGHTLQIGTTNSMTASADSGSVFVDWTVGHGTVLTNGATVTFVMASNLTFVANFQDVTPPVLTITAPLNGAILNNSSVTVTGTATDNVSVSNVWYSLNGGIWTQAGLAGTNWSAHITAVLGTNTVLAYAIDPSGNISPTNSVGFQYELNSALTVITNGAGTINPPLNGQTLQIGSTFDMTATADTGSVFVNWTDGNGNVLTNGNTLTFIMAPGLTLIANFRDTIPPTLTITSPKTGTKSSNDVVNVTGTATDNVAVSNVVYSLNGGPGMLANLSGTNWTALITTISGTNTFTAYAVDFSGNHSPTNSIKLISVFGAQLIVNIVGEGTVKTDYNEDYLAIGHVYSMKATPDKGSGFYYWNVGAAMSNNATLKFTMVSNLVITANFKDITPPTVTITSPKANARVSNSIVNITGTAADNVGIDLIAVRLNSNEWLNVSGTTSWNLTNLEVAPGPNTIQAYAMDSAGNLSKTATVKFTGVFTPDWAPLYLSDSTLLVTPSNGNPVSVSFDATNFSQTDDLTTNDSGTGVYGYVQTETNMANLALTYSAPLNLSNNTPENIQLSFTGLNAGVFTNYADISDNGTFSIVPATNFIPTSWSGHTVTAIAAGNITNAVKFTSTTQVTVTQAGSSSVDTYEAAKASPVSVMLVITDPGVKVTFLQLTFTSKTGGSFEATDFNPDGSYQDSDVGSFTFK